MRLVEGLSIGIAAMRANKMRSLLTMLGIIIGIAAVLAMIAIGDGAKEIVIQDAQKMGGATRITLYQTSYKRENNRWVRIRSNEYMEYEDALAIEAECPSVNAVTPRIADWRGVLFQGPGGTEARAGYNGVGPTYATAMDWDIKEGRFITDEDVQNATKICVLGDELATELFGNKSPLGQEIKIARDVRYYDQWGRRRRERLTERFTVVGTFMPRGTSFQFGWSYDNLAFMPVSTVQERLTGGDKIHGIMVFANSVDVIPKAIEEVKTVIRKRHNNEDEFVRVSEMRAGMAQLEKISKMIKIALGSIAGFSLLVGGIGIMNMMLVSVNERIREIGLRKALGAKPFDILAQFLIEAIVMCAVGGAIGVGLGVFAGEGMAMLAVKIAKIVPEWPSVISMQWVLISVSFSAAIGISFGIYPAIKAATVPPVVALRKD
ncbi:FtsX-like permease family protein [Candidatus Poribacteria bacterium]|nr:ABC transporter permease [Candidatus Poribacteria bacterium]MXY27296.1 FtsX-like permease family protein [Candidatus Poribacteria bacterium]MYK19435.1 FtsX-like permease family protein [Candidatus Poribacteria bacterium]